MEALEALYTRRSIKGFTDQMPTEEEIEKVTKAGVAAPTGMGMQAPYIVVVKNKELRDELSRMNAEVLGTAADPFYNAPVIIVVVAAKSRGTYVCDGSLVIGNMLTAAHAIGLGACWIHRAKEMFASERGKEMLAQWGITEEVEGIGNVALGYAAVGPRPAKPRKDGYVRVID